MAKKAYIGVSGTARKVKKGYVGVGNVARRIKKAYIGVGGVARPCWSGGELTYYGTITPIDTGLAAVTAGKVRGYALFGGGKTGSANSTASNYLASYDTNLTKGSPTQLSARRVGPTVSSHPTGNFTLFASGVDGSSYLTTVDAYNALLVRSSAPSTRNHRVNQQQGGAVGDYSLLGGGGGGGTDFSTVDAYDSDLTRTSAPDLSSGRYAMGAGTTGTYAFFVGGSGAKADAYDADLVKIPLTDTSVYGGFFGCGGRAGSYFVVSGTQGTNGIVEAYGADLTKLSAPSTTNSRQQMCMVTLDDNLLMCGGYNGSSTLYANVDVYGSDLVKTTTTDISVARRALAGVEIGDFALLGTGVASSGNSKIIEAFTIV